MSSYANALESDEHEAIRATFRSFLQTCMEEVYFDEFYEGTFYPIASLGLGGFYLAALFSQRLRSTSFPRSYQDELLHSICSFYEIVVVCKYGATRLKNEAEKVENLNVHVQALERFDQVFNKSLELEWKVGCGGFMKLISEKVGKLYFDSGAEYGDDAQKEQVETEAATSQLSRDLDVNRKCREQGVEE